MPEPYNIVVVACLVRKTILGDSERRILEAYLKGERVQGYTTLLTRIRQMGLKAIVEGSERDLALLKKLARLESTKWATKPKPS